MFQHININLNSLKNEVKTCDWHMIHLNTHLISTIDSNPMVCIHYYDSHIKNKTHACKVARMFDYIR